MQVYPHAAHVYGKLGSTLGGLEVMRRAILMALSLLGLGWPERASAEPAARFVYLRGKGTDTCPAEVDVRQAVVARLGYDPFSSYAASTMFTEVSADGAGFSAALKLVDGDNAVRGDRVLRTRGACRELMEAMALTISIAIDPESATREGPPPDAPPGERPVTPLPSISDSTEPPPAAAPEPAERLAEPAPIATPRGAFASLGPLVSVGSAPGLAFGGALSVDGHYGLLYGGVEGRADAPASASATPSGRVRSSLVMGSLFVGLRRGIVFVAAVGGLGSLHATSREVAQELDADALAANAGLRAGVAVPLGRWLEVRGRLEGLANLTRHTLRLDGHAAYEYPAVSGNLSVALAARFW